MSEEILLLTLLLTKIKDAVYLKVPFLGGGKLTKLPK